MSKGEEMKSTSILFVNLPGTPYTELANRLANTDPSSYRRYSIKGGALPLGILYLSAYLKSKLGESINQYIADYFLKLETIFDYDTIDNFILDIAKKSISNPPDIVAISLMFSTSYKFFKNLLNIYKQLWPNSTFILGGIHATNTGEYILQTTDIDYLFRGESELALHEFIVNFRNGESASMIQGVYSKSSLQQNMNQICKLPTNLDELPFPNLNLIDISSYIQANRVFKSYSDSNTGTIEIQGSRGCPFKCTFCSGHASNNRNIRFRSIENIMEEVKELNKLYGVTRIQFNDDLFMASENRFFKVANAFKNSGIPDLQFQTSGFQGRLVTKKMIDFTSKITDAILFPIDSASQYVQKHIIKKNVDLEYIKELVNYCHKQGLIVRCNIIFGFPNETRDLMNEGADYMRTLNADWYQIFNAVPFEGTEMHDQFVEAGILKKYDEELWELNHYAERSFDTNEYTGRELNDFTYRLNLELNFVNNYNLRVGRYYTAEKLFKEVLRNYPFHIFALISLYYTYKGLNDIEKSVQVKDRILKTIAENESGKEMHQKYRDLLKDTDFYNLSI